MTTTALHETSSAPPLVELTRLASTAGADPTGHQILVESLHHGALAVVDSQGKLLAAAGDPGLVMYLRSAAKPFQALPVVRSGAVDHFGLSARELALICASHHGTGEHVAVVQHILDSIGLAPSALRCGVHWPIDEATSRQMAADGVEPDARHNNCSGKHAGMLALARYWGCGQNDYTQLSHPVQQAILEQLAELTGLPSTAILCGLDGCTVPAFALSLARAALAFACLVHPDAPPERQRVVAAMQSYPHLVSGHDALDDLLMRAGQGRIVCKGGAEGYEGLGVRSPDGRSVGIALKIADGNARAKGTVLVAVLEALGLLDDATLARLKPLRSPARTNHRGQVVGETRLASSFRLTRFTPPHPLEALR